MKKILVSTISTLALTGFTLSGLAPEAKIELDRLTEVLDVNLRSTVQITQAVLPTMTERGWGRIINISSIVALGWQNRSSYSAAKAGLIALSRTWAMGNWHKRELR